MNIPELKKYLSQSAPVPYNKKDFSYANRVEKFVKDISGYQCYKLSINGSQIYRPYADRIPFKNNIFDMIQDVELFELNGEEGKIIGKGWYAKTNLLASIPNYVNMRAIRIRQGNIQIGGETYLDKIYLEKRFSSWHVGEIHLSYDLKLNARRDDFESSIVSEKLNEQLHAFGRFLSISCRVSSRKRTINSLLSNKIREINTELEFLSFLPESSLKQRYQSISKSIIDLEKLIQKQKDTPYSQMLEKIKFELEQIGKIQNNFKAKIDSRKIMKKSKEDIIKNICESIIDNYEKCFTVEELLFQVLKGYYKKTVLDGIHE